MTVSEINSITRENKTRREALFAPYDPVTGIGSPIERITIHFSGGNHRFTWGIPIQMYRENQPLIDAINETHRIEDVLIRYDTPCDPESVELFIRELINQRFRYDFEFWAFTTVIITDKVTKLPIPFKLRQPQRKVLVELERMRLANKPIRIIIDKARQWGGSTLVQIYMAWIQLIHRTSWHSSVVADIDDQARNIRAMYTRLIKNYPPALGSFSIGPFEGSQKNKYIQERGCTVIIGSAQKPDNLRSTDLAMVHLSEVGMWKTTEGRSAKDLAQSVRAAVAQVPYSLIALESTAKGVGNFFHREWLDAIGGNSAYTPIFVAWFEIDIYQKDIEDYTTFINWMKSDTYASYLWSLGATLEGIRWYFDFKNGERYDDWRMKSEFPSTWQESFQATGARVFAPHYVENARRNVLKPEFIGSIRAKGQRGKEALENVDLIEYEGGLLYIWAFPDKSVNISNRYVVPMDIGGRTKEADYTVIRVFDRYWMMDGGKPEIAATWRGHIDQDIAAWVGVQLCKIYNDALFIPESNSYDKTSVQAEGDHFLTILDEVVKYYPNIYVRTDPEKIRQGLPVRYGFHTNQSTKPMIIDHMNGILRDDMYIERDARACDEMDTYEIKPNGTYGATEGCHDDIVMPSAIGLWAAFKLMPMPAEIVNRGKRKQGRITEATI